MTRTALILAALLPAKADYTFKGSMRLMFAAILTIGLHVPASAQDESICTQLQKQIQEVEQDASLAEVSGPDDETVAQESVRKLDIISNLLIL